MGNDPMDEGIFHTESIFSAALDGSNTGMAILDTEWTYLYANHRYVDVFGYTDEAELLETELTAYLAETSVDQFHSEIVPAVANTGQWNGAVLIQEATDPLRVELSFSRSDTGPILCTIESVRTGADAVETFSRYKSFVNQSPAITTVLDNDGTIQYQSKAVERVLGYDQGALVGDSVYAYIHPDDRKSVKIAVEQNIEDPTRTSSLEFRFQCKNEEWIWLRTVGTNTSTHPPTNGFVASSIKISEEKQRDRELERQNDLFKKTQDIADVGAWEYDCRTESLLWTAKVYDIYGLPTTNEPHSDAAIRSYHPADRQLIEDAFTRAIRDGAQYELTLRLVTAEGETRWVQTRGDPQIEDGEVVRVRGTIQDVTTIIEQKEKTAVAQERLSLALEAANAGAWEWNVQTDDVFWDDSLERLLGLDVGSFDGTVSAFLSYVHPNDIDRVAANVRTAVDKETGFEQEFRFIDDSGEEIWTRTRAQPLFDEDGSIIKYVGIDIDITEQKLYEQSLEKSEKRFRALFEDAPDGIILHDSAGSVYDINQKAAADLGYAKNELFGLSVSDYETDFTNDELRHLWQEMSVGETISLEGHHKRKDGTTFPVEVWINKIDIDGEDRFLAFIRDITERKAYETEIEQTQSQLRQIVDLVPDLIFVKSNDGEYVFANNTTATYYGISTDNIEGKTDFELLSNTEEAEAFRKDDRDVIESGERKEIERETLTTADGDTRILQTTKIPFQLAGVNESALLGYARDVTELKSYEETIETQRDNLEILNKMVRHDIRNDLQIVTAYAEMIKTEIDADTPAQTYIEKILSSARNAVDLTETARNVATVLLQDESDFTSIHLRQAIINEVTDVRNSFADAVVTIEGEIPHVMVRADTMLSSVFRNLLKNAIQHNNNATPEVAISVTTTDEAVSVEIRDNGPGIPDEHKEAIFNEGKKGLESDGTGLGLYLVETLTERYGGTVTVSDNDPVGSVFTVSGLPRT